MKERIGDTPINVLSKFSCLSVLTVLAHAVHLTDSEIELLAETKASISYRIVSIHNESIQRINQMLFQ
ncbi:MAG: hypothetical protein JKX81_02575 [Arenicella sp.]|nr:hypothetical protein [Arenicella sp.]